MMEVNLELVNTAWTEMLARILRCPLGGNPEDCPLHEVRLMSVEERLDWLHGKSDKEVVELYEQHMACRKRKLAEQSGTRSV